MPFTDLTATQVVDANNGSLTFRRLVHGFVTTVQARISAKLDSGHSAALVVSADSTGRRVATLEDEGGFPVELLTGEVVNVTGVVPAGSQDLDIPVPYSNTYRTAPAAWPVMRGEPGGTKGTTERATGHTTAGCTVGVHLGTAAPVGGQAVSVDVLVVGF